MYSALASVCEGMDYSWQHQRTACVGERREYIGALLEAQSKRGCMISSNRVQHFKRLKMIVRTRSGRNQGTPRTAFECSGVVPQNIQRIRSLHDDGRCRTKCRHMNMSRVAAVHPSASALASPGAGRHGSERVGIGVEAEGRARRGPERRRDGDPNCLPAACEERVGIESEFTTSGAPTCIFR
jgi:hypothetical protein